MGDGGGGWVEIKLKVFFQPLMGIAPTASWIRWCMQVYASVGVASYFEPNDLCPMVLGCQATDLIPPYVSRNE